MNRSVVHNGIGILQIHFAHEPRLNSAVKSLPSRWNPTERYWWTAEANVVALVALLHPEGFTFCEITERLYRERGGILALDGGRSLPPRAIGMGPSGDERDTNVPRKPSGSESDFTVARLNGQVKFALDAAFPDQIWLVGEVSGFNKAASKAGVNKTAGFELIERDTQGNVFAELKVVLFPRVHKQVVLRLAAAGEPFRLEDEIQVRVRGRVELHVPWGQYRFVIENLDLGYTLGEVARRREEIRRKLAEEGVLGRNRLLPFPTLPLRVGLVTSLHSDAYNDVLRTLAESGFAFSVVAHGARVQGPHTESSVLNALEWFGAHAADFDVLLICRGGGSRTDLAWFDSELIARTVATFSLPVMVGIGHEKDISVLDFVGRSAKTPTAAARQLVDQVSKAMNMVEEYRLKILDESMRFVRDEDHEVRKRASRLAHLARALLSAASDRIDHIASLLRPRSSRHLALEAERVDARGRRLFLLDPRRVVERGYAILRSNTGKILTDSALAPTGSALTAELKRGLLRLRSEGSKKK